MRGDDVRPQLRIIRNSVRAHGLPEEFWHLAQTCPRPGVAEMSAKFRALGAEVYLEEEREATCMLR